MSSETDMLNLVHVTTDSKEEFGDAEQTYVANALRSMGGEYDKTVSFLRKVADILKLGEDIGSPPRDVVVQTLFESNLELRVATRKLREKARTARDAAHRQAYRELRDAKAGGR